jgi:DNA-binding NarL/FixJ family response regulator
VLDTATASAAAQEGTALRVVIADDSVLLREGIARLLATEGVEVAGQAGDADDLVRKVGAHKPDVAITDIRMPPLGEDDGVTAALAIRERFPQTGVLVLSQYVTEAYAMRLLEHGSDGVGYLLKDRVTDVEAFVQAVRRVAAGGSVLDPQVVQELMGRRRTDDPLEQLSPRERDVLALMAEGRTNGGIAEALFVTDKAVERHVTNIFSKLLIDPGANDHRRVLAVLAWLQR